MQQQYGWFDQPENKAKIQAGMEKRKQDKVKFTEEIWAEACKKFNTFVFPNDIVNKNTLENKGYIADRGESHEKEKKTHHLHSYSYEQPFALGMSIEWKYTFCPICREIVNKTGVLIHPYKNQAYRRYFVRNGSTEVTPNTLAISSKPVLDINNLFNGSVPDPLRGGDL